MYIENKTNTEIKNIISKLRITEREKEILCERIFDGETYESIIRKHYGNDLPPRVFNQRVREIQKLQEKLYKALQ